MYLCTVSGKPINVWVVDSAVVKLSGSFQCGQSQNKRTVEFQQPAHSLNVFVQTNGTDGKKSKGLSSGVSMQQILTTQMKKNWGFRKFITPILSNIEKFAEFISEFIFQI